MGVIEIGLAALGVCIAAIGVLFRLWRNADAKAKTADRRADTQERMRDHEREASQMDDTSLADRISRKR